MENTHKHIHIDVRTHTHTHTLPHTHTLNMRELIQAGVLAGFCVCHYGLNCVEETCPVVGLYSFNPSLGSLTEQSFKASAAQKNDSEHPKRKQRRKEEKMEGEENRKREATRERKPTNRTFTKKHRNNNDTD